MFMNIKTLKWDPELLSAFSIPSHILPSLASSAEVYGGITSGPLKGVPITGCLGDQQAALVGQKCFTPGSAKNTYGTGAFLLFNTGMEPVITQGLLTTVAYQLGPSTPAVYALEGSIAVAGAAVKWVCDNLGIVKHVDEIGALAGHVKHTGGVYFVTAFAGLFAPYWRDDARGTIVGITNYTTKHHIARATLEAGCFQTRAILDAMFKESGVRLHQLKVDGGVSNSDVAMQIQADILGIDVVRPGMRETTALGAAIAAGFAVGLWNSFDDLHDVNVEGLTTFKSRVSDKQRETRYAQWEKAVERSYGWADVVESDSIDDD
ncbi:glycerol kinase glpK [Jimgerdemannia flammicorona]|uniref:glycerol kinase n=1 Tax=Jimgerdemannia flammicorona TaxID=994334 RepID=A0A433PG57_9FUNG|nr:glycerol kinase glpK [Jimgerdemannia flammicorona]